MSKKELLARIEQLEQRIAVLEAQKAPLVLYVTRTEPFWQIPNYRYPYIDWADTAGTVWENPYKTTC